MLADTPRVANTWFCSTSWRASWRFCWVLLPSSRQPVKLIVRPATPPAALARAMRALIPSSNPVNCETWPKQPILTEVAVTPLVSPLPLGPVSGSFLTAWDALMLTGVAPDDGPPAFVVAVDAVVVVVAVAAVVVGEAPVVFLLDEQPMAMNAKAAPAAMSLCREPIMVSLSPRSRFRPKR